MDIFELLGFVFGIAGVWLTLREKIWCFPVGLVNVIISLFLFMDQKLYSDAVQQVVYIFLLSYGWYYWLHPKSEQSVLITKTEFSSWLILSIFTLLTTFIMGTFFHYFTDADVPFLDASATALSFTAQYMIAKKKLENWILWMIVNLMYIGIYSYKGLYLYMILFTIYLGMAVYGYLKWRKELSSYAK